MDLQHYAPNLSEPSHIHVERPSRRAAPADAQELTLELLQPIVEAQPLPVTPSCAA